MGLGKSIQGLAVGMLTKKILVVCPASAKYNWQREINKCIKAGLRVHRFKTVKEILKFDPTVDVVIINYEMVEKTYDILFPWAKCILADESHMLKNIRAARTKAFHEGIKKYLPPRLILMSGTPIKNRIEEFYSPILLCSYNPLGTSGEDIRKAFRSYTSFCEFFTYPQEIDVGGRTIYKYYGARNIDRLKQLLKGKYIRREANKVLDLPPLDRIMVHFETKTDPDLLKAWREYDVTNRMSESVSSAKMLSARAKVPCTLRFVDQLLEEEPTRQVIIFSEHPDAVMEIVESVKKKGITCGYITGAVDVNSRGPIQDKFISGEYQILVMTISTGSTNSTLVNSQIVIFNDLSWVPGDNWQAEKRIHRIGQLLRCLIYIICAGEIDEMINKNLVSKITTLRKVL
jgi:SNF2 family DNA or RNA helicase